MPTPYLALALAGPHLLELTGDPALLARWDDLPVAFTVLGIDRIDASSPAATTLDASSVGAALAGRTARGRFLVAASPQRDHPYNLARRVASLGHLSGGRSGVLLGTADAYAPPGPEGAEAWGGAGLGVGAPLTEATAHDAGRAVRKLEQTWPYDAIVGDRAAKILVQSGRIVHADHEGAYSIAGPLNAPEPATGASVVGWLASASTVGPAAAPDPVFDLVLGPDGPVAVVPLGDELPDGVDGIVLRPSADQSVAELLDTATRLLADGLRPVEPGGPLRAALGLAAAAPLPSTSRAAFPVPQPQQSL
ncbi:LLM class flavin-dependent oxidoreductase [Nocardioides sp. CER19]|uniref:LLM class flavin-dependent oxidoreductase n=1 Tax=Nocardioides sp. CER19 TaxID=3038538 RepID=UPI002449F534|nr:LLM class flavin-dependent oxidoreductase [Nocardioides sp. CER19]MDH2414159.1 LLM class flavin-dependent oxidoreductase [Nocardioides sp. CER19]